MSQSELGKRLGKHQQWVHNREIGHVRTKPDEAKEWADACGWTGALLFVQRGDIGDLLEQLQSAPPGVSDLVSDLLSASSTLTKAELTLLGDMIRAAATRRL